MPKFRIEVDGPGQAVTVRDGESRLDFAQFGVVLDAPSLQNFITVTQLTPGGPVTSCLDIAKATLLIETKEA